MAGSRFPVIGVLAQAELSNEDLEAAEAALKAGAEKSGRRANMDHEETIRRYYRAYKEADRKALREITTADLAHVSEFGIYNDRDAMLDEIWPGVGKSWAEDLQIFGGHPDFMVRFRVVGGELPPRNMAEHIHLEGGRIAAIEVFIGRETGEEPRRKK